MPTQLNGARTSRDAGETAFSLRGLAALVSERRWLVAGTLAATLALGALATFMQRPVYSSEATLRIEEQDPGQALLGDLAPLAGLDKKGKLETELVVLHSRQLAESVVDSLRLQVEMSKPQAPRDSLLTVVSVSPDAPEADVTLERKGADRYESTVRPRRGGESRGPVAQPGVPVEVAGMRLRLSPDLHRGGPERIVLHVLPRRETVRRTLLALGISRVNPDAQVVSVRYRAPDRRLAAAVPNAVLSSFLAYKAGTSRRQSGSSITFLREQVASYETQLSQAESELKNFREQAQVVSLADEATEQVKRLAELQAQRDELRGNRDALAQLLARANEQERRDPNDHAAYRQLASFPLFLSNKAIQDMLQSLTALENERATLMIRRTTENPDVSGIDSRVREIEQQLYQISTSYLRGLDSQIASADALLGRFSGDLKTIPAREVEYARLLRREKMTEEIYSLLQRRLKEAEIQNAVAPGDASVVDSAIVADRPVSPRPVLNMGLALMFGLMLGVGVAAASKAIDTKVRSREDVEHSTGGMTVLATIPTIRPVGQGAAAMARNGRTLATNGNGNGNGRLSPALLAGMGPVGDRLVTLHDPRSPASEAYRALRTSLTFSDMGHPPKVVVVTSAMPGDGKSTSSSNLAVALAQQGARTLLVDADLRKGLLHQIMGTRQDPGLTHVLLGTVDLEGAVQQVQIDATHHLDFLGAGVFPPNPAEILGSERMRSLVADLRERYDAVVFDAPPLNLVTDAAVLGTLADTTLLIARAGITDRRALQTAAEQLQRVNVVAGGVILNDFDVSSSGYYGYGAAAYHAHSTS